MVCGKGGLFESEAACHVCNHRVILERKGLERSRLESLERREEDLELAS